MLFSLLLCMFNYFLNKKKRGTSLVVQWLRFSPVQGAWVQSPARELRSFMPHNAAKKFKRKKERKNRVGTDGDY